jgi:transposase
MFSLTPATKIFVCAKPIDMRKSFDGLFAMVHSLFKQDPFSGHCFLFRSKRGNFIKILWWDVDGFAIFAKKLEQGTFDFPSVQFVNGEYQPIQIERTELMLLLEGIDSKSAKRQKRYRRHQPAAA